MVRLRRNEYEESKAEGRHQTFGQGIADKVGGGAFCSAPQNLSLVSLIVRGPSPVFSLPGGGKVDRQKGGWPQLKRAIRAEAGLCAQQMSITDRPQ